MQAIPPPRRSCSAISPIVRAHVSEYKEGLHPQRAEPAFPIHGSFAAAGSWFFQRLRCHRFRATANARTRLRRTPARQELPKTADVSALPFGTNDGEADTCCWNCLIPPDKIHAVVSNNIDSFLEIEDNRAVPAMNTASAAAAILFRRLADEASEGTVNITAKKAPSATRRTSSAGAGRGLRRPSPFAVASWRIQYT